MVQVFKMTNNGLMETELADQKIWIDLSNPTTKELQSIVEGTGVHLDFLTSVLDAEESSRIDVEDGQKLIIVNVAEKEAGTETQFKTIPLGIIVMDKYLITISLSKLECLDKFRKIGNLYAHVEKQGKFTLQIIYEITALYLTNLNAINLKTDEIEESLYDNMEDKLFMELLRIEKTLVYFRNSLYSNKNVVDKLFRNSFLMFYEEDKDLLDDIKIELVQAMEMTTTSAEIIRSVRDGISSLMSNKLNITMQALAAITVIMTIPTMIFSFYGMNVNLGGTTSSYYPLIIIVATSLITLIAYIIMRKRKFF